MSKATAKDKDTIIGGRGGDIPTTELVYHKAKMDGILNLIYDFNPTTPISTSTMENSTRLFGRDIVAVMRPIGNPISYTMDDTDAHSQTPWDEARFVFDTQKELVDSIEYLIIPKSFSYKGGLPGEIIQRYDDGGSSFEKIEKDAISNLIRDKAIEKEFGFKVITPTEAKKIFPKWDKSFLNIQN